MRASAWTAERWNEQERFMIIMNNTDSSVETDFQFFPSGSKWIRLDDEAYAPPTDEQLRLELSAYGHAIYRQAY